MIFLFLAAAFGFSLVRVIGFGGLVKDRSLLTITGIHTVFKLLMSIHRVRKAHKRDNYVKMTIRNIVLAETLVSFVTFLASVSATFGDGNLLNPLFIAVSAVVIAAIIFMGVKMIVEGNLEKRLIKK